MWDTLTQGASAFADDALAFLDELGIGQEARTLHADHLGLRFKDPEDVRALYDELRTLGHECISRAVVNGREIFIFRLTEPLLAGPWKIPCIELPYPKPGHAYEDGWEHVELVLPTAEDTLDSFRRVFTAAFPALDIKALRARGVYEETDPQSDEDQLPNPSLVLEKRRGLTVKFHPRSIEAVVGA